jgi:diacylglycerol kinase family enzyme
VTRPRALVLVNATAARVRKRRSLIARIGELALAGGGELSVTTSTAELEAAAASVAAREHPPFVILVGGDGSHMAGVSAIARALGDRPLPAFALCAGGTVNTTAAAWGSTGDPIEDVTRALAGEREVDRPTLSVVDDAGVRRLGFIFGTGFVARFFALYDRAGGGLATAARLTARLAMSATFGTEMAAEVLAKMPWRASIDGVAYEEGFSVVVSSVLRDVGLGMRITYRAGDDPARIHFVASRGTPTELAGLLPRTLMAKSFDRPDDIDALASQVVLEHEGKLPYILDGDTLFAERLLLSPGPTLQVAVLTK